MRKFSTVIEKGGAYGLHPDALKKPVFRSSAIFPVQNTRDIQTKIIFMGYWVIKKNIPEVGIAITLRNEGGLVKLRDTLIVDSPRAIEISISKLLKNEVGNQSFLGSVELEVISVRDLVFPYPAFVLVYEGIDFRTSVHSTGRVFNDLEDLVNNSDYVVPESGFDIHCFQSVNPFFSFVNGPMANDGNICLEVINSAGQKFLRPIDIGEIKPYETKWINLRNEIPDLEIILKGEPGFAKIPNSFRGFFTRMVAGNESGPRKSITHTYYDSSDLVDNDSYWQRQDSDFYDSSVQFPVFCDGDLLTELVLYPIFSPSIFTAQAEIYDSNGILLKKSGNLLVGKNLNQLNRIDISSLVPIENREAGQIFSCFLILSWEVGQKIPARLKFGLNVGHRGQPAWKSCNICFGPNHGIKKTAEKNGTRKWSPLFAGDESFFFICNSTTMKNHRGPCGGKLMVTRGDDDSILAMDFTIPPFGQKIINTKSFPAIKNFLGGKPGWVFAEIDNPVVDAWYISFSKSGVVAGDHSF